jgi:hypothetical protein
MILSSAHDVWFAHRAGDTSPPLACEIMSILMFLRKRKPTNTNN